MFLNVNTDLVRVASMRAPKKDAAAPGDGLVAAPPQAKLIKPRL